jgi:hypothetical protein
VLGRIGESRAIKQKSSAKKRIFVITGGTPGGRIGAKLWKELPEQLKAITQIYNVSTNYRDYEIIRAAIGDEVDNINTIFIKDNGFAGEREYAENQLDTLVPKVLEALVPDIEENEPQVFIVIYAAGGGTAPIMEQLVREIRALGSQTGGVPISDRILEIVITPDGTATYQEENSRGWFRAFVDDRWRHSYIFSNRQKVTTLSALNTKLLRALIPLMYQFVVAMEPVNFVRQFNSKVSLGTIGFSALDSDKIPKELIADKAQQVARDAFTQPTAGIDPKTYNPLLRAKRNIFALATAAEGSGTEDIKRAVDTEITNFASGNNATNLNKLSVVQLIAGWSEISVTTAYDVLEEDVASFLGIRKAQEAIEDE